MGSTLHATRVAAALVILTACVFVEAGELPALHEESGLVRSLDSELGNALSRVDKLPESKIRKPVGRVLKAQLPDGRRLTKPPSPPRHALPSQQALQSAAAEHAASRKARNARMEAVERDEKVASITTRERTRKNMQPQPPGLPAVRLKVTSGEAAKKVAERANKRNKAAEIQRKKAEYEVGPKNDTPVRVSQVAHRNGHDERRLKVSEVANKHSEKKHKLAEKNLKKTERNMKHKKLRTHVQKSTHTFTSAPPVHRDPNAALKDLHERAEKHRKEGSTKEKVKKSRAHNAMAKKAYRRSVDHTQELKSKEVHKPSSFEKFHYHLHRTHKSSKERVNKKGVVKSPRKPHELGASWTHREDKLLSVAHEIASLPKGSSRTAAENAIREVATNMAQVHDHQMTPNHALKRTRASESLLIGVADSVGKQPKTAVHDKVVTALMDTAHEVQTEEHLERRALREKVLPPTSPSVVKTTTMGTDHTSKQLENIQSNGEAAVSKEAKVVQVQETKDIKKMKDTIATFVRRAAQKEKLALKMHELERHDMHLANREKSLASTIVKQATIGDNDLGEINDAHPLLQSKAKLEANLKKLTAARKTVLAAQKKTSSTKVRKALRKTKFTEQKSKNAKGVENKSTKLQLRLNNAVSSQEATKGRVNAMTGVTHQLALAKLKAAQENRTKAKAALKTTLLNSAKESKHKATTAKSAKLRAVKALRRRVTQDLKSKTNLNKLNFIRNFIKGAKAKVMGLRIVNPAATLVKEAQARLNRAKIQHQEDLKSAHKAAWDAALAAKLPSGSAQALKVRTADLHLKQYMVLSHLSKEGVNNARHKLTKQKRLFEALRAKLLAHRNKLAKKAALKAKSEAPKVWAEKVKNMKAVAKSESKSNDNASEQLKADLKRKKGLQLKLKEVQEKQVDKKKRSVRMQMRAGEIHHKNKIKGAAARHKEPVVRMKRTHDTKQQQQQRQHKVVRVERNMPQQSQPQLSHVIHAGRIKNAQSKIKKANAELQKAKMEEQVKMNRSRVKTVHKTPTPTKLEIPSKLHKKTRVITHPTTKSTITKETRVAKAHHAMGKADSELQKAKMKMVAP